MKKPAYNLIFGLTADPIHKGHEQVILNSFTFAEQQGFKIEQFTLVPTYHPNLIAGKKQPRTAFEHRFKMCELVVESIRNDHKYPVYVFDIEQQLYLQNNKRSFSYDTLKTIESERKLFVLSADHFKGRWPKFRKWHQWQQLVQENGLLIHQRPGNKINISFIEQLQAINPDVFVVSGLPQVDVSSTRLRSELSNGVNSDISLLSESVLEYIEKNKLYLPDTIKQLN